MNVVSMYKHTSIYITHIHITSTLPHKSFTTRDEEDVMITAVRMFACMCGLHFCARAVSSTSLTGITTFQERTREFLERVPERSKCIV